MRGLARLPPGTAGFDFRIVLRHVDLLLAANATFECEMSFGICQLIAAPTRVRSRLGKEKTPAGKAGVLRFRLSSSSRFRLRPANARHLASRLTGGAGHLASCAAGSACRLASRLAGGACCLTGGACCLASCLADSARYLPSCLADSARCLARGASSRRHRFSFHSV